MKSIIRIFIVSALFLCVGCAIAYYNTASLGYDNANIVSYSAEELRIFDIRIKYKDFFDKIEKGKKYFPDQIVSI